MQESQELVRELTTLRDLIRWASSEFNRQKLCFGHGFASALDEAVYLTLHALALPWNYPVQYFDAVLLPQERQQVIEILRKRIETRQPAAYLTGEAWFAGLPFYVDERVLVPRSPIAELIAAHFEPWIEPQQINTILDLCTGSGCIAIACQMAFPQAEVAASDISQEALQVAAINLERHGLEQQITLYPSDLFDSIPPQKFDLIVSNPPYVDRQDMQALPQEFIAEPQLGLEAGEDGLNIVDRIFVDAVNYLSENSLLIVEVGNSEAALMMKYPDLPLTWIDFQQGGSGVFCISGELLRHYMTTH